jgi:hypothetical protein
MARPGAALALSVAALIVMGSCEYSIQFSQWGHEAWPQIKPMLRRALEMRRQIARDGWLN